MLKFENTEDKTYLVNLLSGGDIIKFEKDYKNNFDFRPVKIKRREFNKNREKFYKILVEKYGNNCQLKLSYKCLKNKNLQIDHLIPLSSNVLNKILRNKKAKKGKKVITQSLGSNHINNLVLACKKCNGFKKHRIIPIRL